MANMTEMFLEKRLENAQENSMNSLVRSLKNVGVENNEILEQLQGIYKLTQRKSPTIFKKDMQSFLQESVIYLSFKKVML